MGKDEVGCCREIHERCQILGVFWTPVMRRTAEKATRSEQTGNGKKTGLRIRGHGQWSGKDKTVPAGGDSKNTLGESKSNRFCYCATKGIRAIQGIL